MAVAVTDIAAHRTAGARWGFAVFALALAVRLLFFWGNIANPLYYFPILDEAWYVKTARLLTHGEGHGSIGYMDPLYAWWLAGWFRTGAGLPAVRMSQLALDSVSAWLVYRLGGELWSQRAGIAAGLLYAAYGASVFFSPLLLKVTLLNALLLSSLLLLAMAVNRERLAYWVAGGALMALGVWLRANFYLLLGLVPLLLWLEHRRTPRIRPGIAVWLATAVVCILLGAAGMWTVTGQFHLLPKAGGYVLYITNHAGNPRGEHRPPAFVKTDNPARMDRFFRAEAARRAGHPFTTAQAARYWTAQTFAYWEANPLALPRTVGNRLLQWLSAYEIPNNYNMTVAEASVPWLAWLPGWGIALGLGLPGMGLALRARRGTVLVAPTLAVLITGLLFFVTARLRLPAVPFLLVGAGILIDASERAWQTRTRERTLIAAWAAAVALLTLATWLPHAPPDTRVERYNRAAMLVRMHRTAEARREAETLVAHHPTSTKYRFLLGNTLLQQHDYSAAAAQYRLALKTDPGRAGTWHNLGLARLHEAHLAAARDAFSRALTLERDPLTLLLLGKVYDRLHRNALASACYAEALKTGMLPPLQRRMAREDLHHTGASPTPAATCR